MPGRSFSAETQYRYGFNGKENDRDISDGAQDYGMRINDSRLGRFLSNDPLAKSYPDLSPYHFAGNNPIKNLDLDGGEPIDYRKDRKYLGISVNNSDPTLKGVFNDDPSLGYINVEAVYDQTKKQVFFITDGNDGSSYYWKHNTGADQSKRMKGNGEWERYETPEERDQKNAAKVANDHSVDAAIIAPIVAVPGAVVLGSIALGDALLNGAAYLYANAQLWAINNPIIYGGIFGFVRSMGDPSAGGENPLGQIETFTANQVEKFISTEEGAIFQSGAMKKAIQEGGKALDEIAEQPIQAVLYNGKTFILNGHNRLKAYSEIGKDVKVTMVSIEKATEEYKDKMGDIIKGAFKTELKDEHGQ